MTGAWTLAATEDASMRADGAEVRSYLRAHRAEGLALVVALDGSREAYTGDLTEP